LDFEFGTSKLPSSPRLTRSVAFETPGQDQRRITYRNERRN